jgi:hypothetical protein
MHLRPLSKRYGSRRLTDYCAPALLAEGMTKLEAYRFFKRHPSVAFLKYGDVTWVQGGYRSVAIGFLVAGSVARLFPPRRGLRRPGVDLLPTARW